MIHQDFWLTPGGPVENSATEHARTAKAVMLGLTPDDPVADPFGKQAITAAEVRAAKNAGADPAAVKFLQQGGDPRLWAMQKWGWVRTAKNGISLWELDENALDMLRMWVRSMKFDRTEAFDLNELSTNEMLTVTVKQLGALGTTVEGLRRYGQGVGRFRNPPRHATVDDYETMRTVSAGNGAKQAVERFFRARRIVLDTAEEEIATLTAILDKYFGYTTYALIGSGSFGTAFLVETPKGDQVIKLTTDPDDINTASVIRDLPAHNLATVHRVGFTPVEFNYNWAESIWMTARVGIIVSEFLPFRMRDARGAKEADALLLFTKDAHSAWGNNLIGVSAQTARARTEEAQSDLLNGLQEIIDQDYINEDKKVPPMLTAVQAALNQLRERGLFCVDVHSGNFGSSEVAAYSDARQIKLFDFGIGGNDGEVPSIFSPEYFAQNPPPGLPRPDGWPFQIISPARGAPEEFTP